MKPGDLVRVSGLPNDNNSGRICMIIEFRPGDVIPEYKNISEIRENIALREIIYVDTWLVLADNGEMYNYNERFLEVI